MAEKKPAAPAGEKPKREKKARPDETPRQRFERVAGMRVGNALAKVGLIANISNARTYDYAEADIAKVEAALTAAVEASIAAMRQGLAKKDKKETGAKKPAFTF